MFFLRVVGILRCAGLSVRQCHTWEQEHDPRTPASHAVGGPHSQVEAEMLPRLCSQGTMVNSPSPKGKAFLLGQLHSLGDGGGQSICSCGSRVRAESRSCWQRESGGAGELALESP